MSLNFDPKENTSDLPDNKHDLDRMKPEKTTIEIPEVEDIPGQEHIYPAPLGELADVTASSADEEGESLWPDENEGEDL